MFSDSAEKTLSKFTFSLATISLVFFLLNLNYIKAGLIFIQIGMIPPYACVPPNGSCSETIDL